MVKRTHRRRSSNCRMHNGRKTHGRYNYRKTIGLRRRSQRGGDWDQAYDDIIEELNEDCTNIVNLFGNCNEFKRIMKLRTEWGKSHGELKHLIIYRMDRNDYEFAVTLQPPKMQENWIKFVGMLRNMVPIRNDYYIQIRKLALKRDGGIHDPKIVDDIRYHYKSEPGRIGPVLNALEKLKGTKRTSSASTTGRASAAPTGRATTAVAPAEVAPDTRPKAPPGWVLRGNTWQDGKGGQIPAEFYRQPTKEEEWAALQARFAALNDD